MESMLKRMLPFKTAFKEATDSEKRSRHGIDEEVLPRIHDSEAIQGGVHEGEPASTSAGPMSPPSYDRV